MQLAALHVSFYIYQPVSYYYGHSLELLKL